MDLMVKPRRNPDQDNTVYYRYSFNQLNVTRGRRVNCATESGHTEVEVSTCDPRGKKSRFP